ncbi:FMN-dependent alpha-hydroxy acid dehydrogenase [Lipomyces kononenkoae]|uniref:FMN-dependent alpha-hydroxy acid dehydrogenase n=1 Tax=Lipomyces kononenkoae TaxID=34357 RepID=A0ACC3T7S9_LIPKO
MQFQEPVYPSWAYYQTRIYSALTAPKWSTDSSLWESEARAWMPMCKYNYVYGTAGQGHTHRANIEAFSRYRLIPRMLSGATVRDLSVTLFGKRFPSPILVGPIGVQSIVHPHAELASARAAAKLNVPFVLSTASSTNMETVAEAHAAASVSVDDVEFTKPDRWYQLYWPKDDQLTVSLLRRAERSGFSVLVVTLDTFSLGFRPADLDQSYLPFIWGEGCAIGFNDPVFNEKYDLQLATGPTVSMYQRLKLLIEKSQGNIRLLFALLWWRKQIFKSLAWIAEVFSGTHKTWEDLKLLRDNWNGPIVLKGIQSVEDARLAIKHGMDGVIVSNHGGRQADGAIASLDALAKVTADEEVRASNLTIMFDSGIRSGSDIVKALALGAKAVLIGRPYVYGLALGGQEGVEHVLKCLLADADIAMANIGRKDIADLDRCILDLAIVD